MTAKSPSAPKSPSPEEVMAVMDKLIALVPDAKVEISSAVAKSRPDLAPRIDDQCLAIPLRAPVLWKEREKWRMSPAEFIKKVYAAWMGRITLPDIADLDPPLAQQYSNWVSSGRELPEDFVLPTKTTLRQERRAQVQAAQGDSITRH